MWKAFVLVTLVPLVLCGDVISITKDNEDELHKHPVSLVKYYAPWCGHCKALAPHYEEAATELKTVAPLFEINCDDERPLCDKAGIEGFPTLKLYSSGVYTEDYQGARTKEGIVQYMLEQTAPPATEIVDATQFKLALESNDYTVILQSKKSEEIEEFQDVARKIRKFAKFYYTKDMLLDKSVESIIQLNRPKNLESKLEESTVTFNGKVAELEKWVRENLLGLVGIRNEKLDSLFRKPLLITYTQVDFERNPSNVRYHRNRLLQIAKADKSNLQFALADISAFGSEVYEIGLTIEKDSSAVVIRTEQGKNYVMEGKFSVDAVKKFIADFTAGKLEEYVKSEPIPTEQEGDVVKVVGKTFKEIVLDSDKDVLIEFFAPWCGHCKALKPKYEELAKKLSKEKDVVIAAIDATANTYPKEFSITGYPSIFWVPKNSKDKPEPYSGGRETDDLLKFVAKSATNELASYTREGVAKQEEL